MSLAWARYDSRPLLKANEPRGRAESARRRRKCVVGFRYGFVAVPWLLADMNSPRGCKWGQNLLDRGSGGPLP